MSQMEDDWKQIETIFDILQAAESSVNTDDTVTVIFDKYHWSYIQNCLGNSSYE
jgi:hypothetical protein